MALPPPLPFDDLGSGLPLVFLHGLGSSRRQTVEALSGLSGVRLVAPDLPGHGEAPLPAPPDAVGFGPFARAVRALLDALGLERVVLGGLSMGAGLALSLALAAPERVAGLVLVRPSWLDRSHPAHLALLARVGRWLMRDGPGAARTALHRDAEWLRMRAEVPGAARGVEAVIDRPRAIEHAPVLEAMIADRPFEEIGALADLPLPALVAGTPADPLHPEAVAARLAAALPEAELVPLPARYLEPDRHRAALRDQVGRLLRRTSR